MFFLFSHIIYGQIGVKAGFSMGIVAHPNTSLRANFGAHLGITYTIKNRINLELQAAGIFRHTKTVFIDTLKSILPVTFAVDYYFGDGNVHPYIGIGAGAYFSVENISDEYRTFDTNFGLQPRIGMRAKMLNRLYFDLSVKYHVVFAPEIWTIFGLSAGFIVQL